MLEGFGLMPEADRPVALSHDHSTVFTPLGTRLVRIYRLPRGWRVWTATKDFKYGSYLELFDDGRILNCTVREDEGDENFWVRPSDEHIRGAAARSGDRNAPKDDTHE